MIAKIKRLQLIQNALNLMRKNYCHYITILLSFAACFRERENNYSHTNSSMKPLNDLRKCSLSVEKYVSMHLINLCLLIMGKCFSTPPSDVERHKTVITCIMRQGR